MKPNYPSLISVLTVSLLVNHSKVYAATQLPYFGPDQKKCNIKQPEDEFAEIDSGFVTSEDCSFIYVLPPSSGYVDTTKPIISQDMRTDCRELDEYVQEMGKFKKTDPEYKELRDTYDVKKEQYASQYNNEYSIVVADVGMKWNQLVRAYQKANRDSQFEFKPMPIKFGVLSIADANKKEVSNQKEKIKITVSSYKPPENQTNAIPQNGIIDFSYISNSGTDFIMGQKVGLKLMFDFQTTCSILMNSNNSKGVVSGTYTYAYPVQSKGLKRYTYDVEKIKETVKEFIESTNNDTFKTEDLIKKLQDKSQLMSVELNYGLFPDVSEMDKVQFANDLTTIGYNQIFNSLAKQKAISLNSSYIQVSEQQSRKECWFWFLGCRNVTFTIYKTVLDWTLFKESMIANLKIPEVQGSLYQTHYLTSTSSMVGKE